MGGGSVGGQFDADGSCFGNGAGCVGVDVLAEGRSTSIHLTFVAGGQKKANCEDESRPTKDTRTFDTGFTVVFHKF